jgi:predicted acyl esterase
MMGLPTVTANVATTGNYGQIDARLWDLLPGGEQRLISRGVYRLTENQTGAITFQLHGNGYEFAQGDTVKLELLGRDAPYYRATNPQFPFTVKVSNLSAVLPTL